MNKVEANMLEKKLREFLAPYAMHSAESRGRGNLPGGHRR